MKKTFRFSALTCVVILVLLSAVSFAFAAVEPSSPNSDILVCDFADLLSEDEEATLSEQLNEIRARLDFDVVIVTTDGYEAGGIVEYADAFYEEGGYGAGDERDGCVFVLDMGEREYYISTAGFGIYALSDSILEYMEGEFLDLLSEGYYYQAFSNFASDASYFVAMALEEAPYDGEGGSDSYYYPDLPEHGGEQTQGKPSTTDFIAAAAIAIIVGLIIGFASSAKNKKKLISVEERHEANDYIVPGSLYLTKKSDKFMYSTIMVVPKPKDNNNSKPHFGGSTVHTSIGGMSHGGRGGHF